MLPIHNQLSFSCPNHGSTALCIARLQAEQQQSICCIIPTDELLEPLARDISLFTSTPVLLYPAFEIPPYARLNPDPATTAARIAALHFLHERSQPGIILASAEAVLRRVLPGNVLNDHCELVMAGEDSDREGLLTALLGNGYQHCELVQQPGDLAGRGGIVDCFPPPFRPALEGKFLRLAFKGDMVESIRVVDPLTQRSEEELDEAILLPAADILFPRNAAALAQWQEELAHRAEAFGFTDTTALQQLKEQHRFPGIEFLLPLICPEPQTLFDYLPQGAVCVVQDPLAVSDKVGLLWERIEHNCAEAAGEGFALPPKSLFLSPAELERRLAERPRFDLCPELAPDGQQGSGHTLLQQEIELGRKQRGVIAPLAERLTNWLRAKETAIIACRSSLQAEHLEEMLAGCGLHSQRAKTPLVLADCPRGALLLVEHPLSQGFDLPDEGLHILSAGELFGEKRLGPSSRRKGRIAQKEQLALEDIAVGETAVHRDHGLACFQGLVNMDFAGQRGDFLLLEFLGNDRLYVPVDQLHLISRYQGLSDEQPKLDKLGSSRWQTAKRKVTEAVWQKAQELLDIYARREMRQGHSFEPPGRLYKELAESFPYDETEGQAAAIDDVLRDLLAPKPMDRLVCGDVGYGKTEVAVRAACKVIEDGFQVAVLVPTTVLAEQHAATFRERFAGFNINVACTSRFRSSKEQKQISNDLKSGQINLVVGTHRLLSDSISFHKLGLLIVDEEHRFGVSHKERLKRLRANIDVLTLTATPIPRTLQMSLLGIRDLSVISSPPRHRRAVKTFLARKDDLVIREAVQQELARGGQVFFIHNRIQSIHAMAEHLHQLAPTARIAVAHGQMPGSELEEIMVSFISHEVDVLVCTTIVESGLDIANANTIIINRADRIGLADIYQLRGRVGRATRQSYAYLLVPDVEQLTSEAEQRLRALMDCSELGSGFKLAMNDLQLRGGGSLLGESQSGHIAAVGYDLYLELLQATVADLKSQAAAGGAPQATVPEPEIKLPVAAFLPDDYVRETGLRYRLYRRLSAAGTAAPEQLADLKDELIDRFGPLPPEAETLFSLLALKHPLRCLGISKVEQAPVGLVFSFSEQTTVAPETLLAFIERFRLKQPKLLRKGQKPAPEPVRLTPDGRLIVALKTEPELFAQLAAILRLLGWQE
ncbi:MAG: transcription-repair coupling factor [Candidatus Electronema aureum]|uniref:Transcription-repair-coupling factor n=1 Tax=Candidatus Electronema aureum TaxID=2005002 RepID=A0A521G111_9BACT|nr:MAG: transcription-repair coupling factor [Candidatus Electronema aureum]